MMRILFISNFYPPHELGGYEQWCQEIADSLAEKGHKVQVLTSRYGVASPPQNDFVNGIAVSRSLYLQADLNYYNPANFVLNHTRQERANGQILRQVIDEFRPEVIMVWGMWNLSHNVPFLAEQWLPGRVAYFVSSYWPMDTDPHTLYWQLPANHYITEIIKRPLRAYANSKLQKEGYPPPLRFEHAVCCSQYVRNTLVKAGKLPATAGVLYGGSDPQPFLQDLTAKSRTVNGPLRLLYFGRLIHDKGVHTAVEALGLLKQNGSAENVSLTILGSGHPAYEANLKEQVARLKISDQVRFIDKVPREEIPDRLKQFDAYLFTSIWAEPMARSVMEAMAAGLLVIGTEVGGQPEMMFHQKNALTFKAEDASKLAEHIALVKNDRQLLLDLARAGQKLVLEKFTLTRMSNEVEQLLAQVASMPKISQSATRI